VKKIKFYTKKNGKSPVLEFIKKLDYKTRLKVFWTFELIKNENNVSTKYFKKLKGTSEIWEIRVKQNKNAYRFLGFVYRNIFIILNHAFVKKTKKTPTKEIGVAKKRKEEFYE